MFRESRSRLNLAGTGREWTAEQAILAGDGRETPLLDGHSTQGRVIVVAMLTERFFGVEGLITAWVFTRKLAGLGFG